MARESACSHAAKLAPGAASRTPDGIVNARLGPQVPLYRPRETLAISRRVRLGKEP